MVVKAKAEAEADALTTLDKGSEIPRPMTSGPAGGWKREDGWAEEEEEEGEGEEGGELKGDELPLLCCLASALSSLLELDEGERDPAGEASETGAGGPGAGLGLGG